MDMSKELIIDGVDYSDPKNCEIDMDEDGIPLDWSYTM